MGLVRTDADGHAELVEDRFVDVSAGEITEAPDGADLLVSLEQWQEYRERLLAGDQQKLGIRLRSDQSPMEIREDLPHLSLVALEFPRFRDGRAYTYARLLRERLGFGGEIRAVGDVLLEQLHFMHRCGFNAFEIDAADPLRDWRLAAGDHTVWYQATGDGRRPARDLRTEGAAPPTGTASD